MAGREDFAGTDATPDAAEWDAEVRARALARLGRRPPRSPRYVRFGALAILGMLHALLFWRWYASRFPMPPSKPTVVQVRLIDDVAVPMPPMQEPTRNAVRTRIRAGMARQSMAAELKTESPAAAREPLLFNRDGSVRLPPAPHFETPLDAGIARGRELLARGHNLIHCRRSKFDDSPTPAETASAVAQGAHMAHLVMGNPLDPLNDVGEQQHEDGAGEHAANKREIEERACDD